MLVSGIHIRKTVIPPNEGMYFLVAHKGIGVELSDYSAQIFFFL